MMDWIFSNIYIVVIIGFAIFTAISSRSGKGKTSRRPPSMPTFGGSPLTGERSNRESSPPLLNDNGNSAEEAQRRYHEAQRQYDNGSDNSYEQDENWGEPDRRYSDEPERSLSREGMGTEGLSSRQEALNKRLDSLESNLNQRTHGMSSGGADLSSSEVQSESAAASDRQVYAEQLRQGVIWAEILGPPRSRQSQVRSRPVNRNS
ncbi:hypothetical protein [Paenibacillus bovis]|uniref:Uncharacterized protein n=1 Tax=Paenibacillus bovis TaxID=1616788 RepID=A0A172ZKF3_9BACL|nr:hypothetical protein [Paenibacillus bovis]ANF97737.1 hypothetical protein AR543_18115 [Paenibacillus bovis]